MAPDPAAAASGSGSSWWPSLLGMPLPLKNVLTKAQEARQVAAADGSAGGGGDVFEEARQRMEQMASTRGWIRADGGLCIKDNAYWFISATKPM